jgi:hypothetical protein
VIVDPDFLDHWRTRMVADALSDEMAPVYIMRLWGHCQIRKSDRFKMPAAGLKAQCRYPGDAQAFEQALTEAGFIERDGDEIVATGWTEKNASLLAAWENGSKGGRPKKETQPKPTGNPAVTQGKPNANPDETQAKPIREDKSREDKTEKVKIITPAAQTFDPLAELRLRGVQDQTAADWFIVRKAKKAGPLTETALAEIIAQADKAKMSLERALVICCRRSWAGFNHKWLSDDETAQARASPAARPSALDQTIAGLQAYLEENGP